MDTYERTYSTSLGLSLEALDALRLTSTSTSNDYAIACALAGVPESKPLADTSMDAELALQLHEREASKLLRKPSRRAHRRSKRLRSLLRHLKPTRVIPRVNPVYAPTASYVSEDRNRLLLRLDMYGLQERQVQGDGNCQFRALSDQLYYKESRHAEVRQAVVDQLCCFPERYRDYVTTDYKEYVSSMSKLSTWGDHVTLQAAADAFHVGINIITSFLENCVITISPTVDPQRPPNTQEVLQQTQQIKQQQEAGVQGVEEQAMQQLQQDPAHSAVGQELQEVQQPTSPLMDDSKMITLWLAFWAEVHYNSLAPKPSASEASGSVDDSSSEGSISSEDEGKHKVLGSKKLGRLFH